MSETFKMGEQRAEIEVSRLMVYLSSVEQMLCFQDLTKAAMDSWGLMHCDFW